MKLWITWSQRVAAIFLLLLVAQTASVFSQQQTSAQDTVINHPLENFEALWTEFNDRYSFFDMKQFTWQALYQKYRPQVNDKTTNGQLFAICSDMLKELQDIHVTLSDEKTGRSFHGGKPVRLLEDFPNQRALKSLSQVIDTTLTQHRFAEPVRIKMDLPYLFGYIMEYSKNKQFGYLRVNMMFGLAEDKLHQAIDEAIESLKDVNGVIIDVRFNTGGLDTYAFAIANRFADKKRLVYYRCLKEAKKGFTPLEPCYLNPSSKQRITKPIVVITSSLTVSAADVFALAMKQLPYVTIIGENTQGYFSDTDDGTLPNGWAFTLSFQKYYTGDMKNLECIGVTPDIKLLNTQKDVIDQHDPLLEKALAILQTKTNQ